MASHPYLYIKDVKIRIYILDIHRIIFQKICRKHRKLMYDQLCFGKAMTHGVPEV